MHQLRIVTLLKTTISFIFQEVLGVIRVSEQGIPTLQISPTRSMAIRERHLQSFSEQTTPSKASSRVPTCRAEPTPFSQTCWMTTTTRSGSSGWARGWGRTSEVSDLPGLRSGHIHSTSDRRIGRKRNPKTLRSNMTSMLPSKICLRLVSFS